MNQGWFDKHIVWNVSIDMISFNILQFFAADMLTNRGLERQYIREIPRRLQVATSLYDQRLRLTGPLQRSKSSVSANWNATRMTLPWVATYKYAPPPLGICHYYLWYIHTDTDCVLLVFY